MSDAVEHRFAAGFTRSDREELKQLLRTSGVVRATPTRPVVDRHGAWRPWGLYTPGVTLEHRGMMLAGRALLKYLSTFRSTQIAAAGFTAMPLVGACVLLGDGRYSGLVIRDTPKAYLTRQLIDGSGDTGRPVAIIDDSISSGTSLRRSIAALENHGFEVEGAIALVAFPYRDGLDWAYRVGYRVESVFDVWRDLGMRRVPDTVSPGQVDLEPCGDGAAIPSDLSPPVAARRIAEAYLRDRVSPRPPERLDGDHDGRGGVWVSFRDRRNDYRVAREGLWHFDAALGDPCRDLVRATVAAVEGSVGAITLSTLPKLKIGVTFFGPLEPVSPARLDYARYGIVVRDLAAGRKIGGALPNTQVFIDTMGQYNHACVRNAGLAQGEPHDVFRHEVFKVTEPGETWPPYGVPDAEEMAWTNDLSIGKALVDCAFASVRAKGGAQRTAMDATVTKRSRPNEHHDRIDRDQPRTDCVVPYGVQGVAVGFYRRGRSGIGVAVAVRTRSGVEKLLDRAAALASSHVHGHPRREDWTVVVTLLHDPEYHPSADAAAGKLRPGLDAVVGASGTTYRVGLPSALTYNNMKRRELVRAVEANLVYQGSAPRWMTYRTTAWIGTPDGVRRMEFGFPRRRGRPLNYRATIELLADHIVRSLDPNGVPRYHLDPIRGTVTRSGTSPRVISALTALHAAGRSLERQDWISASAVGLEFCLSHAGNPGIPLPGHASGALADCVLLAGVSGATSSVRRHPAVRNLAARVVAMLRPDGRICRRPTRLGRRQDHEFLPGAALLAAALAEHAELVRLDRPTLSAALRWHRGRFRVLHGWGMVGWQPQAWAAVWRLTGDDEQAAFTYELADWAIARQLETSGAFLENLAFNELTFNTGFIAEGIASAWELAIARGDKHRAESYRRSWSAAFECLDALIVRDEDTFCMVSAKGALGGVRTSISRSEIRVDAVSHVLRALVAGERLLR